MKRLAVALLIACGSSFAHAAPAYVLITSAPGVPPSEALQSRLAGWRQSGVASSVVVLDAAEVKASTFGGMAIVEFPDEETLLRWRDGAARDVGAGLSVTRVDLLVRGETSPRDSARASFVVSQSDAQATAQQAKDYAQKTLRPEMEAVRAEKGLTSYWYFVSPGASGQLHATFVAEYRDPRALSRRAEVRKAVAQKLSADLDWKRRYDEGASLRADGAQVVTSWTELPAPDLSAIDPYVPQVKISGGLRILGSELKGAVDLLAAGFNTFHPDAVITTSHIPSSEGAVAGLYLGVSDIAPAGDDAKITDLMPYYNTFKRMPLEVSIATGGYEKRGSLWAFAAVVSRDNPLNSISLNQLKRVFGAERTGGWELTDGNYLFTAKHARPAKENIRTWGQLGLTGEYATREIDTFGYSAPGFAIYFERNWFAWSKKWNPNFREYVEEKQTTPDAQGALVASDRPLEDLAKNKYAIGLAALMHVRDHPHVKVLAVSATDQSPAIPLTPENVSSRKYPMIRDAFIYVNKAPGQPLEPKVREFLRYCLSREGQEVIARAGFYFPLTPEYLREQLKKVE